MRVIVQRVSQSKVDVNQKTVGQIGRGLLVLAGFEEADTTDDLKWMAAKIVNLRIFADEAGVMNRPLLEVGGELLIVSQFTLHALTKKGNRPSYIKAARPELAKSLYDSFVAECKKLIDAPVACGVFGADMQVSLINDGPVTIFIDSKNKE